MESKLTEQKQVTLDDIYQGNWQQLTLSLDGVDLSGCSNCTAPYIVNYGGTPLYFDDISLEINPAKAQVLTTADYYPFGSIMRESQLAGISKPRFGYQGDFAEDETETTGWNSFELRMYDGVIGRWLSVDPYGQHWSPYLGMGNNPVNRVDPDGGKDGPGDLIGVVGDGPCKCSTVDAEGNHVAYFIDELHDWPDIMSLDYWLHDEYWSGDSRRALNTESNVGGIEFIGDPRYSVGIKEGIPGLKQLSPGQEIIKFNPGMFAPDFGDFWHEMKLSLIYDGNPILGQVYYPNGKNYQGSPLDIRSYGVNAFEPSKYGDKIYYTPYDAIGKKYSEDRGFQWTRHFRSVKLPLGTGYDIKPYYPKK